MSRESVTEQIGNVALVQEQLLDMLRMAGNDVAPPRREVPPPVVETAPSAPAAKVATAPPRPGTGCPKCGSETSWGTSSWCPDCGYYPKAGFEGSGIVEAEDDTPPTLISVLPAWVAPTALGAVGLTISSIATSFVFHDPLQRSLVALTQLLSFAGLTFAVHTRASFLAIKEGRGWMACVNLSETWSLMMSKMPASKTLIFLLGWGLSGIGTSFLIGLDVDMIAEEVAKEVKNNPKVTFADMLGAMTKVTKKAFGNKNVAMEAVAQLTHAMGGATGGVSGEAGATDLEGAIGSLAGTTSSLVDEATDGGPATGDLEGAVGELAGTANQLTEDAPPEGGLNGAISGLTGEGAGLTAESDLPGTEAALPESTDPGTTETLASLGGKSNPLATSAKSGVSPSASLPKHTYDYWIYGYTTNPDGEIRSFLLASTGGTGTLRFSQKFGLEGLSSKQLAKLTEQLKPYRSSQAAVTSPYGGKWVKPVAKCRVTHEGLNADSRPTNPTFQKLVLP